MNSLDRWMLGERNPHDPAPVLALVRLRTLVFVSLMLAIMGIALMLWSFQIQNQRARIQNIERVTHDCVDRDGDIAFREVLADLIKLNEKRPQPGSVNRSDQTVKVLQNGLRRAGKVPDCVINVK